MFNFKYKNSDNFNNKVLVNILLILLFFIIFVILFSIGYQSQYKNISVLPLSNGIDDYALATKLDSLNQPLPLSIRTIRAIGLFSLGWYLLFCFKFISLSKHYFYKDQNVNFILSAFSFTIICALILMIKILIDDRGYNFKNYLKSFFEKESRYYYQPYKYDYKYWIVLILFVCSLPIVWFSLFRQKELNLINPTVGYDINLWFNSFQYFTIQTNLLCCISLLIYLIYPQWKLFKGNKLIILLASYITIVCLVFNLFIIPFNSYKYANNPYKIARTVIEHGINPVLYVSSFIIIMFKDHKNNNYFNLNKTGLIIPSVYGVYALLSPLACGISVYGFITNTNPNLISGNLHGNYATFLVFIAFALIFSLFNYIYWLINNFIYKKYNISKYKYYLNN